MTTSTQSPSDTPQVAVYYDRDCGFCRRAVDRIVRWFFVRTSYTGPAQEHPRVAKLMADHDSWVVINAAGEAFVTFQAGVEIARHSPVLRWLVPLAKPRFMQRFGEWVYRKVAQNRHRLWLP